MRLISRHNACAVEPLILNTRVELAVNISHIIVKHLGGHMVYTHHLAGNAVHVVACIYLGFLAEHHLPWEEERPQTNMAA